MNDILDNIRNLRTLRGYNQGWMGQKLGMSQNGYSLIEAGKRGLQYSDLCQIAIIFNMSVIDIVTYPEKWAPVGLTQYENDGAKVILQIELKKEKKDQVMKLVFGDNNIEILNK